MDIYNDKMMESLIDLSKAAGRAIMEVYESDDFDVQIKNDSHSSPLTKADLASNDIIVAGLNKLTPDIHIVTEEDENSHDISDKDTFWLVDPLDGTKEFVKKNGEFTVNIGLIKDSVPVLGVVYAPDKKLLYYGDQQKGAFKAKGDSSSSSISTKTHETPIIVVSRSHINKETENYLKENYPSHKLMRSGSSLKICLVAEGSADCYPRLAPTMEWDTAAADAVLRAAGGSMANVDGTTFSYGKERLFNTSFICKS